MGLSGLYSHSLAQILYHSRICQAVQKLKAGKDKRLLTKTTNYGGDSKWIRLKNLSTFSPFRWNNFPQVYLLWFLKESISNEGQTTFSWNTLHKDKKEHQPFHLKLIHHHLLMKAIHLQHFLKPWGGKRRVWDWRSTVIVSCKSRERNCAHRLSDSDWELSSKSATKQRYLLSDD